MNSEDIIAQAIGDVFDEQISELSRSLEHSQTHVFSRSHNKKMRRIIKRQRKPYFKLVCTAGRRAACIAAAAVVLSASAMSVKAVRKTVFDFVTTVFSDHKTVSADSAAQEGYPKTIEEEYHITALPQGFKAQYHNTTDTMVDIPYYSTDSRLLFTQHTKESFNVIFSDTARIEDYTDTDGQKYQIVITQQETVYIWDNGRYVFMILGGLDREEMLDICKSVRPTAAAHKTE